MEPASRVTIAMFCEGKAGNLLKYSFAAVASLRNAVFYYFTPDDIRAESRTIHGYTIENDEWVQRVFPYPDAIYDRIARRGRLYPEAYGALEGIPMSTDKTFAADDKLTINQLILDSGKFEDVIIPSEKINSTEQIFAWLERFGEVIVKPARGMQGKQLFYIRRNEDGYIVIKDQETSFHFPRGLTEWLKAVGLKGRGHYLVQPFIRSATKNGNPFDFRAHMCRGENGELEMVKIYPRIGNPSGVVSNFASGGYVGDLKNFYVKDLGLPEDRFFGFRRRLTEFSLQFAEHLQGLLDYRVHEIGLDLGMDPSGKIWLFEANMNRLGKTFIHLEVAKKSVPYIIHLARTEQERKKQDPELQLAMMTS
ncbi:YheC/YheD family protein [Paenibacillus soyae]|uniref:YheC/YheD family protein n=1 Tax=Paenibacillus soyae TaxID=2969249 RepID=A0A9X2MV62_9BACL|nr:YheC/YheD family protein [Paenibacillus soyae]MCR2806894.1 YheC/YheD family protein [Paenibacillus soyae]